MEIVRKRPPNFLLIVRKFPEANRRSTIFAYAPDIYTLYDGDIPEPLIRHEKVHIERQLAIGVDNWWKHYLEDPDFRWEEELLAHSEEYRAMLDLAPSRQMRRSALKEVAAKLSSPLYGRMVTRRQAEGWLTDVR